MKEKIFTVAKYVFLFLFFFLTIQFLCPEFLGDAIYNYGFSYGIYRGEIPYVDFNMIIPPLGAFFYAIFFWIFGCSYVVLNLTQAFLLCVLFHYLHQLYGKNSYFLLLALGGLYLFPFLSLLFPGYNFLLFLELVLLFYCEKKGKNDYGIGFLLGLSFLTKQTVGFFLALVSLYYIKKDIRKVFQRMIGFSIPCFLFFLYLLVTKSLVPFFDMCFLGMFDFTSKNGGVIDLYFVLFFVILFILLIKVIKDKKNIQVYYVLAFSTIAIPLFDYYHVALFCLAVILLFLDSIVVPFEDTKLFASFFLIFVVIVCTLSYFSHDHTLKIDVSSLQEFQGMIVEDASKEELRQVIQFMEEKEEDNLIIIGNAAYILKIMTHRKINQYDLLNYGNHGYHGTEKLIQSIQKEKNPIFIFSMSEYAESSPRQQINKEVMKYVKDHYTMVGNIESYAIYREE